MEERPQQWCTLLSSACHQLHHKVSFCSSHDEARQGSACFPHLLHLWQAVQQADSVLRVGLVVLAAGCSYPQRPRAHGLQNRFIEVLANQREGELSQVVFQHSWKSERTESVKEKRLRANPVGGFKSSISMHKYFFRTRGFALSGKDPVVSAEMPDWIWV